MIDPLDTPSKPDADQDTMRRQAKQRFMGAGVLVLIAVVALPFVLDSQPRPLPASVVIDIPKMEAAPVASAAPSPAPAPAPPLVFAPPQPSDGVRAQGRLEATPPKSQYIVQAGSYSDADKLKAAAAKLDRAGMAYYTQAAEGRDGTPRTRLRLVGPFASREEANSAAAKVVKLGVASIVLKP